MKLLSDELLAKFAEQGKCDKKPATEVKVIAKFFNPAGGGTWYATEYDPIDRIFFGFVSIFNDYNDGLGLFSLEELLTVKLPFGFKIERDLHFGDYTLQQILDGARP